jgi:eukaryotic-like serine/threonine-protein kinase
VSTFARIAPRGCERMTTTANVGQLFGRYHVLRLIGAGGMGAVYQVELAGLSRQFALKTLLPSLTSDPSACARFLREAEAASRIRHPNVVDVLDVGIEDGTPYFVMEYLEGESLAATLARQGRLEVGEAVDLMLSVFAGVSAGHDLGVVHRDLKPDNILLARTAWGQVVPKVLDFGVSKISSPGATSSTSLTKTFTVVGTAPYMSPEQARGESGVDARSDQYSLGLVLYELVAGVQAYAGHNHLDVIHRVATGAMRPLGDLRPELPDALLRTVARMLLVRADERFPSLRAAGAQLLPLAGERTRLALDDVFRTEASSLPYKGSASGTMLLPVEATRPETDRTQLLAGSARQEPPATTLRRAAAEVAPNFNPARRRTPRTARALVAGTIAVASGAVALVWIAQPRSPHPLRNEGNLSSPRLARSSVDRTVTSQPDAHVDAIKDDAPAAVAAALVTPADASGTEENARQLVVRVLVESEPPGAYVAVDGQKKASRTPLTLNLASRAPCTLRLIKAGYETITRTIVPVGDHTEHITLQRRPRIAL